MEYMKIAALLLIVVALALALDTPWLSPKAGELPQVYLSVDRIRPYEQHGSVTIMDGDTVRDIGVAVRRRGNSTTNTDKISFSFRFWKKASVLGMDKNDRWVLLGTPYDKSMIRNSVGFDYARALGLEGVPQMRFCELYVRKKYYGLYVLSEPVNLSGLGLDEKKGDFILERNKDRDKEGTIRITTDRGIRFELHVGYEYDHAQACLDTVNAAERAICTLDMAQYAQYIDVDSFVNAYIAQEVVKHIDFAQFSDRYFVRDGKLYAGPLWDLDLAMGNVSAKRNFDEKYALYHNAKGYGDESGDSTSGFWAQRDWFEYLCQDPAFMQRVAQRWKEVYPITENLIKENALGESRIDYNVRACAPGIGNNYDEENGWSISQKYSDLETWTPFANYQEAVEHLRGWLERRILWLDTQFDEISRREEIQ